MNRATPHDITVINSNEIFVYGSNLAGEHNSGAAKRSLNFGAKNGIGIGICGNTYGIPTKGIKAYKDAERPTLSIAEIATHVVTFASYVANNTNLTFYVTPIGCGRAGYEPKDIAPLFKDLKDSPNVYLPESFWEILNSNNY